ncbi:MAG TPA: hypothetical protein VF610_00180, partial [Segetibacter sp.]
THQPAPLTEYVVDENRILGNTYNEKGHPHCRFHLFVRWQPGAKRKVNPFTYRGDHFDNVVLPEAMLCSLLRNFQRNHIKDQWLFAYLHDTMYFENDNRRIVLAYVNGVVEENRLHNYYTMLRGFPLMDLLKTPSLVENLR